LCGSSSGGGGGGGGGVGPGICVLLFISDVLFSFSHFDVRKHDGNSWVFSYQTSLLPQVFFWPLCFLDTAKKQHNTRGTPRFNMDCVKSLDWCMYNGEKKNKTQ
jgi:hypothetical protein